MLSFAKGREDTARMQLNIDPCALSSARKKTFGMREMREANAASWLAGAHTRGVVGESRRVYWRRAGERVLCEERHAGKDSPRAPICCKQKKASEWEKDIEEKKGEEERGRAAVF